MPSRHWLRLLSLLLGAVPAVWGTALVAYQESAFSPDDLNGQFIRGAEEWDQPGFRADGYYQKSPADFGPITGMPGRTFGGGPADGEQFPIMQPGSMPGGLSPWGFNGSGMQSPNMAFDPSRGPMNAQMMPGSNPRSAGAGNPLPPGAMNSPPRISRPQISSATSPHVGLVGQMARPGVYEITSGQTSLTELVERIGGLTKGASGQLRVIRNGRPGQTITYSPSLRYELFPGDLIIADAQASNGASDPRVGGPLSARPATAQTTTNGAVQIGFINLMNRPVVLKLRSEHASVSAILSLMRQDATLASQINVVMPSSYRFQSALKPDTALPSETVLIFPRNSVAADRLVALPEPYTLKQQQQFNQPAPAEPTAPRNTPDSESAEQVPATATVPPPPVEELPPPSSVSINSQRAARSRQFVPDRVSRDSQMTPAPPAEESGRTANESSTDRIQDQDSAAAPLPPGGASRHAAEPHRLDASGNRRPIGLAGGEDSLENLLPDQDALSAAELSDSGKSDKAAQPSLSIWPPLIVAGAGMLTLIGYSLALRRRALLDAQHAPHLRTPHHPETASSHANTSPLPSAARRDVLDALIQNEVPVTEEPIRFASPLQFHGRPLPPKFIRVDNRHDLPAPHSPSLVPEAKRPHAAKTPLSAAMPSGHLNRQPAPVTATSAMPPKQPTKPPCPVTTQGPLDRALRTVQQRGERA